MASRICDGMIQLRSRMLIRVACTRARPGGVGVTTGIYSAWAPTVVHPVAHRPGRSRPVLSKPCGRRQGRTCTRHSRSESHHGAENRRPSLLHRVSKLSDSRKIEERLRLKIVQVVALVDWLMCNTILQITNHSSGLQFQGGMEKVIVPNNKPYRILSGLSGEQRPVVIQSTPSQHRM